MLNPLNPVLIAVGVANGAAGSQAVWADISGGVGGGYVGAVNFTVGAGWAVSLSPRAPLLPLPPCLAGSATPYVSAAQYGPGTVLALLLPEANAFAQAGAGTITGYL